jgi:peptidoglycan-associated lipoprotein
MSQFTEERMVKKLILVLMVVAGLAAQGCSSKGSKSGSTDGSETGALSDSDLALQNSERWADGGNIPVAQAGGPFKDVHFGYDSSNVDAEYHEELRKAAETLRSDPSLRVEIEGHCDNRGTSEYNMALGERRAKAVGGLLMSFGAPSTQMTTVSYGEELPLNPSINEEAFAENRRAHFAVYKAKAS